jgi:hypothetical protein
LLDLKLGAYTLVTYRPSDLHPELRKAIDVVAATRVTDAQSLDAIAAMCGESSAELKTVIEGLAIDEAAILPGPVAGGKLLPFKLLPRLTPHVRHRVKYFDVSVIGCPDSGTLRRSFEYQHTRMTDVLLQSSRVLTTRQEALRYIVLRRDRLGWGQQPV